MSSIAARRLCAAVIACISPVKCRLMSSIGSTCAQPPPVAPPFTPNTGPKLGSLKQTMAFFPNLANDSASPTEVVDFPSPALVGVIAVTRMSLPDFLLFLGLFFFEFSSNSFNKSRETFAIWLP